MGQEWQSLNLLSHTKIATTLKYLDTLHQTEFTLQLYLFTVTLLFFPCFNSSGTMHNLSAKIIVCSRVVFCDSGPELESAKCLRLQLRPQAKRSTPTDSSSGLESDSAALLNTGTHIALSQTLSATTQTKNDINVLESVWVPLSRQWCLFVCWSFRVDCKGHFAPIRQWCQVANFYDSCL